MVTLFRGFLWFNLSVVTYELWIILVRIAAQESVVALETAAQRPAIIWTGGRVSLSRGEMPLTDCVGVLTVLQ